MPMLPHPYSCPAQTQSKKYMKRTVIVLCVNLSLLCLAPEPLQAQPGSLDTDFNAQWQDQTHCLAVQPDGKVVVGGADYSAGSGPEHALVRFNADGSRDTTFQVLSGSNGTVVNCLALQPDGRMVIGVNSGGTLARINPDGSRDTTFQPYSAVLDGGIVPGAVAVQPDGKIVVGGGGWVLGTNNLIYYGLLRYNQDGTIDVAFNTGLGLPQMNDTLIHSLFLQTDGKIVIGGQFSSFDSTPLRCLARIKPDGNLDPDFLAGAGTNWIDAADNALGIFCVTAQPDGRIIIGGSFTTVHGAPRRSIARLNTDGSLDTSFDPGDNIGEGAGSVYAIAVQPNGRILVGGTFRGLTRLNRDGSLDSSFGPCGYGDVHTIAVALAPGGKIVIGLGERSSGGTVKQLFGDAGWGPVLERRKIGNGPFEVGFYAEDGKRFQLQTSENFTSWADWTIRDGNNDVLWIPDPDATATNSTKRFYRAVVLGGGNTNAPTGMVWIPPGTFTMGSPTNEVSRFSNEGPQTQVTISRGFWISKYETTQEEYLEVMGTNPSNFKGDVNRPVERVTWTDATNYCGKLTARERDAGKLPAGYEYRLPTEAEWEYACRAGTTSATAYGNSLSSAQANFNGKYPYGGAAQGPNLAGTTTVGSYPANAWGLYDMHGNVWEWCLDWYGTYPGGSVTDPRGPTTGSRRVIRGSGWLHDGSRCRSAFRVNLSPGDWGQDMGFRPVLAPAQ